MNSMQLVLTLLLLFTFFIEQALADDSRVYIKTPNDLIKFSNDVNNGDYIFQGTVTLENDLDMSEASSSFNPIGFNSGSKIFCGTFDGQGHTISNLNITSESHYAGLFGVSGGLILKNLVLDESCSISSNKVDKKEAIFICSFVSYCYSRFEDCLLKNLINMAPISAQGYNYIGGISSFIMTYFSSNYYSRVINCLNMGSIEIYNPSGSGALGGIVGATPVGPKVYVQNCANYGNIYGPFSHKWDYSIGGIVGVTGGNTVIQNCLNSGDYFGNTNLLTGNIVGKNEADEYTKIKNCYWLTYKFNNEAVSGNTVKITGGYVLESSAFSNNLDLINSVVVNYKKKNKVVDALNSFNNDDFEEWLFLDFNGGEVVKWGSYLSKIPVLKNKKALIKPTKEGYIFRGWCLDPGLKTVFNPDTDDISSVNILYAKWALPIKVTFIVGAEKIEKKILSDETIEYPQVNIDRGNKAEWCTKDKKICNPTNSNEDIELYFTRSLDSFTISFNTNGGNEIEPKPILLDYPIRNLPIPEKDGSVFLGWFSDPELNYLFYLKKMPGHNISLHAKWKYVANKNANSANALNCFNVNDLIRWVTLGFNDGEIEQTSESTQNPLAIINKVIPKELKKDGYTFKGWYSDPEFKTKFNQKTDDISNVKTLCAKWLFPVKVTFIFDAEKVEKTFLSDETIKYPKVNVNRGYKGKWCIINKKICNLVNTNEDIELYFVQHPDTFTLSFNTNGGNEIKSKNIIFGELIGELPVPEKDEHVFLGWFIDPELKHSFYMERMPANDINLYAMWKYDPSEEKRIVMNALGCSNIGDFEKWVITKGNGDEAVSKKYSGKVPVLGNRNALRKLNSEKCVFRGWYSDPEFKTEFNSETDDISRAETLYAKWASSIKVTFVFGTEKIEKNILSDEVIEYPQVKVNRGYKREWCSQGKKVCNPTDSGEDIELYFIQTPKEYTLSFNTSGGNEIEPKAILFDDVIGELPVPEKDEHVFLGWFIDPELKYPVYMERMPSNDINLYAKWKYDPSEEKRIAMNALSCSNIGDFEKWVIMKGNCGEAVNKKYSGNAPVLGNKNVLRKLGSENCIFRGWYLDSEFKTKFNLETDDISSIKTLYAKWASSIKVTFIYGSKKTKKSILSDEVIEYPQVKVNRGYKGEWCTTNNEKCNPTSSDEDIELYFIQTPKEYTLSFNTSGGNEIEPKAIVFDNAIGKLPVPEKEGSEFLGWFIDPELKHSFYMKRMPYYNVSIHAKWRDASSEARGFAKFIAFICTVASVLAAGIILLKREFIGLNI